MSSLALAVAVAFVCKNIFIVSYFISIFYQLTIFVIKYFLKNKFMEAHEIFQEIYFGCVVSSLFFNDLTIFVRFTTHRLGIPVLEGERVGRMRGIFSVVISINTTRQMTNSTIIYYNLTFVYRKVIRSQEPF